MQKIAICPNWGVHPKEESKKFFFELFLRGPIQTSLRSVIEAREKLFCS
jgi:hypothetical protein